LIELQIPFSDPIADGPTIRHANDVARAGGVRVADSLELLARLRPQIDAPLLFITYFNVLFRYGVDRQGGEANGVAAFCRDAAEAGAFGLIIPDIPVDEEQEGYLAACRAHGLAPIPVLSPELGRRGRWPRVAEIARDYGIAEPTPNRFAYCQSVSATTGSAKAIEYERLADFVRQCRAYMQVPIGVGFGIRTREEVELIHQFADFAIVGSQALRTYADAAEGQKLGRLREFVRGLRREYWSDGVSNSICAGRM
jgi:tryptophan synthase alpha subunit